ncbi:hypothetical protein ABZ705_25585 [Streptomyces sp. NPDC006984]|uniref:hypothetical protein n=1 Tax=Streptomyces sp. NPDC006984 TaxID=3155463 RepID=UPI0033E18E85
MPTCIWADYATVGVVNAIDLSAAVAGGKGLDLDQLAELTAEHYDKSRSKA